MNAVLDLFHKPAGEFPPPRECQTRALQLLRDGIRNGKRRQVLVMPTGGGKTMTALHLVNEAMKKGKRAIFLCDRIALINQTSARADEYGIPHGVIQGGHWRRDLAQLFQIGSIQTIQARGFGTDTDIIIVDECHTTYKAWTDWTGRTKAVVIGLTATPFTKGLGEHFDGAVNAATMDELTRQQVLVPLRILTCVTPDMADAATAGGEWTAKAAGERELTIIGDVVTEWRTHGENRKTIAFGANIAYCTELVGRFNAAGIHAASYTSETPDDERAQLLAEFSKPNSAIRVLVSVAALAKGFDQPDVGCVIDARPLRKSLSEVIQMWGRGLRSAPGKLDCILLDFSGNARRFHDDFVEVYFNGCGELDTAEKMDAKPRDEGEDFEPAGCPQCQRRPFKRRCLSCGFEKAAVSLESEAQGVMQEIRIGKKKLADSRDDLWRQVCGYARTYSKPEKQAGRAGNLYRNIMGEWPPREFDFQTTEPSAVSSATLGKIKSLDIAYRAALKKAPR